MTRVPFPPPTVKLRRVNRSFPASRSIGALILREMSTRYGRSPGGYAWALLEPLGGILVLSVAFSLLLRAPPLGNSFLLFYASGYLAFQLYMTVSNMVSRSVNFSRALLFYPAVTWLDAVLARAILNSLTGLLVTYVLLTGILVATDTRTILDFPPIALSLALAILLALGIGTLNCALMGLFPVWDNVWGIATKPLFLASGILFIFTDMPANVQAVLWWNPLVHIIGLMRRGIYATYVADYVSVSYVLMISMVTLVAGLLLMGRYHRDLLNNL